MNLIKDFFNKMIPSFFIVLFLGLFSFFSNVYIEIILSFFFVFVLWGFFFHSLIF